MFFRKLSTLAKKVVDRGAADPLIVLAVTMQGALLGKQEDAQECELQRKQRLSQEAMDAQALSPYLLKLNPNPRPTKQSWTLEDTVAAAKRFCACMERDIPTQLCAVCARLCRPCDVRLLPFADGFEGLELLEADAAHTEEHPASMFPRHALAFVRRDTRYCLQPEACVSEAAHACRSCMTTLQAGHIPRESLVAIDPGPMRTFSGTDLPHLTHIESKLLSTWRAFRFTVVCKADGTGKGMSQALRSDVVAFPAPSDDALLYYTVPPKSHP